MNWSKLGFIVFFWLFYTNVVGQPLNQKDANGKKTGKWLIYQKGSKKVFEEGNFVNGRKEGVWKRYFSDGITVMIESNYRNNRPSGTYTKFYQNGKLKERGSLEVNKYNDSLVKYYQNGKIEYVGNFNTSGLEEGAIKYFYENGNVEFEYQAKNGAPSGTAVRYFENGTIKEEINYGIDGMIAFVKKSDKSSIKESIKTNPIAGVKAPVLGIPRTRGKKFFPNGYNKCYTINDEIWQDGTFKNGELWDGKVYEYDKDGILIRVKIFKQGVYHSNGQL
jgi:antitoxin component YwqK of YwqJK toxin-antitoxin module